MAEIDNWIKEQLKKGFKKEQIKEGLKKAGYQQDIIDSVDLLTKKQKNKKTIFFLGLIAVLIIIFIVGNYIWTHKSAKEISSEELEIPLRFSLNLEEFNKFNTFCEEVLLNENFKDRNDIFCNLEFEEGEYYSYFSRDFLPLLGEGKFFSITLNLNKLIKESSETIQDDNTFSVCIFSSPSFDNPLLSERDFIEEMKKEKNDIFVFPEGAIICKSFSNLKSPNFISLIGFVPETKSINANAYLIKESTVLKSIQEKNSYNKIKEIIKQNYLLWEIEKGVYK